MDVALHANIGPVALADISQRQEISLPRGDVLFVARFLLSPLGYKPRAAIKSPLV